uniref:Nidogen 1a n=1 Tax=Eptatretus burgeri TaxID=7764 RepID=A0A8C4QJN1_EPTBU
MSRRGATFAIVLLKLLYLCDPGRALPRSGLYPYGERIGDALVPPGDDASAGVPRLRHRYRVYSRAYRSLHVGTNGVISPSHLPPESHYINDGFPTDFPLVSPFLADLTTEGPPKTRQGRVFFREDLGPGAKELTAAHVASGFPHAAFTPRSVIVVTWEHMRASAPGRHLSTMREKVNTFQAVLASNGTDSFAIFLYPSASLQFLGSRSKGRWAGPGLVLPARAGFCSGIHHGNPGLSYALTTSLASVRRLTEWGNAGRTPGIWVFHIGSARRFGNVVAASGRGRGSTPRDGPTEEGIEDKSPKGVLADAPRAVVRQERSHKDRVHREPQSQVPRWHHHGLDRRASRPVRPQHDNGDGQLAVEPGRGDLPGEWLAHRCSDNEAYCSPHGVCRDYRTGFCCACQAGYYGNGRECFKEGEPQRISGQVTGRLKLNRPRASVEELAAEIHAYAVAADGRAYAALSPVGPTLGWALQLLPALAAPVGWLFARERHGYDNGFRLAGGQLSHHSDVTFQPGGERLSITQHFTGLDPHGHLAVNVHLDGTLPDVPDQATMLFEPYLETYHYHDNGMMAQATQRLTLTSAEPQRILTVHLHQNVTAAPCKHTGTPQWQRAANKLSVSRLFGLFNPRELVVRYALAARLGVDEMLQRSNPCDDGTHDCGPNSRCQPGPEMEYSCDCIPGFMRDGHHCVDVDECVERPCGANAHCRNFPSSFTCECDTGFQLEPDDRTCSDVDECGIVTCPTGATCINQPGAYTCHCPYGFSIDGQQCQPAPEEQASTMCQRWMEVVLGSAEGRVVYVPQCDEHGAFKPTQCGPAGECWCVTMEGREILGTRSKPGIHPACLPITASPISSQPTQPPERTSGLQGPQILYAQGQRIGHISLDGTRPQNDHSGTILSVHGSVNVGLAYDCVERMVYFTDVVARTINRVSLEGGESQTIISTGLLSPEGLTVDSASRNLFWVDSGLDRLEVARLDGSMRRPLINTELVNPRAIVADPTRGMLYWTDWNRAAPKIESAYMDGTQRQVLVRDNLGLPNGLTLEPASGLLCWVDAGTKRLECIQTDGQHRRVITSGLHYPFSLSSLHNYFYYTDWRRDSVRSLQSDGGDVQEYKPTLRSHPYGITIVPPFCSPGSTACTQQNGGCSHLCLPTPQGRSCRCPEKDVPGCVEGA